MKEGHPLTAGALKDLTARYRQDGYVVIRDLIPADEIAQYRAVCDAAVSFRKAQDKRTLEEKSSYEQSFIQCQYIWEDTPGIRPLTFHPAIGQAVSALLGCDTVRLWHDQALYKEGGGRPTEAHQDHPYWPIKEYRTITAWIPLVPVDDRNGCMGYVPGSHLTSGVEFTDIFRKVGEGEDLLARQTREPVFVTAEPGDVIFHDGRTVHLARGNGSDHVRRAYTAIYFADGCTRLHEMYHPSVDREGVPEGAKIEGYATPVAWPLRDGEVPNPGPWPPPIDDPSVLDERSVRAQRMGIVPKQVI